MLWIFILGIMGFSFSARYSKIKSIDYSHMFPAKSKYAATVENVRVMSLNNDYAVYQQNKMASYFLNWEISKNTLETPDYYQAVILVDHSFQKDAPDVIIDPADIMRPFFNRLPQWQREYKREGELYKRKKP
jgi:hypothetical protein